jgi:hypothetical protein
MLVLSIPSVQSPLDKLLLQLNRKNIVDWVPEMKLGRPAYDHIQAVLENGKLSVNQIRNGLHALFRLRDHGSWQEVFDIFVRFSNHENEKVRTEAVTLAVGSLRFSRNYPLQPLSASAQDLAALRHAVELGVEPRIAQLAQEFLAG